MKSSFTFIRSAQNWESPGLLVTYVRDLEPRYLLRRSCSQMPSLLVSLHSHLLKRHLFWISKFIIPRPPGSLGLHRILHFESLYFLLCPSSCQKNLDLKKLSFLRTSFGISKKQSIYTDRLLSTELIKVSLPPWSNLLFHVLSCCTNLSSITFRSLLLIRLWWSGIYLNKWREFQPLDIWKYPCSYPAPVSHRQNNTIHFYGN